MSRIIYSERAKVVNHEYQQSLRAARKKERLEKVKQKASETRLTLVEVQARNKECENVLLQLLGNPNPDGDGVLFGNTTRAHLDKCTIKLLKAFIHSRAWSGEKPRGSFNWPKKKPGYIAKALEYKDKPVILEIPSANDDLVSEGDGVGDTTTPAPAATIERMGDETSRRKPSEYLSDDLWVTAVRGTFQANFQDVDEEMKELADKLWIKLFFNVGNHIENKVEQTKRSHFTLKWARDNLAQFAAVVALAGQIDEDLDELTPGNCLLKHPGFTKAFLQVDREDEHRQKELSKAEGCYLYYDTKNSSGFEVERWPEPRPIRRECWIGTMST